MCWMDSSAMAVPFSRWTKAPGAWLVRRPTCLRTMVRARCYGFRMARTQAPCAGMHEVGSVQTQLVQGNGGRALEHYCEEWDLLWSDSKYVVSLYSSMPRRMSENFCGRSLHPLLNFCNNVGSADDIFCRCYFLRTLRLSSLHFCSIMTNLWQHRYLLALFLTRLFAYIFGDLPKNLIIWDINCRNWRSRFHVIPKLGAYGIITGRILKKKKNSELKCCSTVWPGETARRLKWAGGLLILCVRCAVLICFVDYK